MTLTVTFDTNRLVIERPRIHHYIPCFYTKRWTGADNKLCQFSKPHREIIDRRVAPAATGYGERAYELKFFPPELAQQIEENFFRPVDNQACVALNLMESRDPLQPKHRIAWARFILSLQLRLPSDIELMRDNYTQELRRGGPEWEEKYAQVRTQAHPITFQDYLDQRPPQEMERDFFRGYLPLIDNQRIIAAISNMYWMVLDVPPGEHDLLTSDAPVIQTDGLHTPAGHLALPIGPRRLFIAFHKQETIRGFMELAPKDVIRSVNRLVVERATNYVYGRDTSQMRFVQNRFGSQRVERLISTIVRRVRTHHDQTEGIPFPTARIGEPVTLRPLEKLIMPVQTI